jgi:CubicO group peptidase (beta-lactamase class C family)
VRELLGHTSGLSGWEEPQAVEQLADWERCTSLLAAQAPWWDPGTQSGYHAVTQGHLVGEVVRRITGLSPGRFFKETVADPLGADFHIGLPAEAEARVARVTIAYVMNRMEAGLVGDRRGAAIVTAAALALAR